MSKAYKETIYPLECLVMDGIFIIKKQDVFNWSSSKGIHFGICTVYLDEQ
jgi:hypothetical protein